MQFPFDLINAIVVLDAPIAFGVAVKYWSQMIPRLFNLPLKVLTAPLSFAKRYLGSLFAQPVLSLSGL